MAPRFSAWCNLRIPSACSYPKVIQRPAEHMATRASSAAALCGVYCSSQSQERLEVWKVHPPGTCGRPGEILQGRVSLGSETGLEPNTARERGHSGEGYKGNRD